MINIKDKRTLAEARTFINYPRDIREAVELIKKLVKIVDTLEKQVDNQNQELD